MIFVTFFLALSVQALRLSSTSTDASGDASMVGEPVKVLPGNEIPTNTAEILDSNVQSDRSGLVQSENPTSPDQIKQSESGKAPSPGIPASDSTPTLTTTPQDALTEEEKAKIRQRSMLVGVTVGLITLGGIVSFLVIVQ